MTTLHLKANSRGSWTNVCTFKESDGALNEIFFGCMHIRRVADGVVSFKITDDHGVTLYSLDGREKLITWQKRIT